MSMQSTIDTIRCTPFVVTLLLTTCVHDPREPAMALRIARLTHSEWLRRGRFHPCHRPASDGRVLLETRHPVTPQSLPRGLPPRGAG